MKKKILVVDDSATLRASVNYTLKEAGFETINAVNGVDGLEKLNQAMKNGDQIGMIISDINMPVMDGITFIHEVKKTPFKFTPILVLTTESQEEMKMKGKKAGASGWLVKPFKPEQLVYVTKKFMR
ncbi:MAG: response regulator [Desulfomonilia bacterium]|jgi:two-component system chemotaxis response regulator CheY|uniref:Chemotaxis protein CheY n=1 Tax=anaerobic digester metagenome TaxID=1263854 RepID=A0A485M5V4_9ZZZZ|nr:response regulator [Pseudomonadota bacterium]HON38839.1 response regulator [Deltaproteobacteria bacterium]HRS56850.1 response regulator [Desulfomonilia bacterium]HPD22015.1 response regulator [Deltaproteobacteria bacterium]HPX19844.1 response regulator [Deltaproteobacteria bacterium]